MRSVVAVLAILATVVAAANASGATSRNHASAAAAKLPRIAVILPGYTANELILDQKNGAQAAAKALHASLILTGSNSAEDQVKAGQTAIAAKVDAIVYNTIDAKAFTSVVLAANKAHIPIVCSNSCAAGGKNAAKVTFNYLTMGQLAAKWLASQLPSSGGTLGIVDGNQADQTEALIYKGLYAGLKAAGATPKIIVSPPTNWDPAAALTVSQNFLTANPNLNALICMHDLIANACQQNMNSMNYPQIPLAGLGGTCQGISNMLNGRQKFTVVSFLYRAGYLGVQDAIKIVTGHAPTNLNQTAPMIGLTTDQAKSMLSSGKAPFGLITKLKKAQAGCK